MTSPTSLPRRWLMFGWIVLGIAVLGVVVFGSLWFANRADDPDAARSAAIVASAAFIVAAATLVLEVQGRSGARMSKPRQHDAGAQDATPSLPSTGELAAITDISSYGPVDDEALLVENRGLFSGEFAAVVSYVERLRGRRIDERSVRTEVTGSSVDQSQNQRDTLAAHRTKFEEVATALLAGGVQFPACPTVGSEYLAEALEFLWRDGDKDDLVWYIWPVGSAHRAIPVPVPKPVPVQMDSRTETSGLDHDVAYAAALRRVQGTKDDERPSLGTLRFRVSHHLTLLFKGARPLPMGYIDGRLVWARLAPAALKAALRPDRPFGATPVNLNNWLVALQDPKELGDLRPRQP